MRKLFTFSLLLATAFSASAQQKISVEHVEPLSWWTGMNMPLQLMINGEGISECDVKI